MSQPDFLSIKKGVARVIIKTRKDDELPVFELDMIFSKSDATKILVFVLELKGKK